MTLEQTLIKAGMDEKQARIYLAGLELGAATVLQISKKSGVKRPTTYVLLDQMVEDGFFTKSAREGRPQYAAADPKDLLRRVHEREEALKASLPELAAIMASTKARPKISIYEGVRGMTQVYDDIFKSPEARWYGSIHEIMKRFPESPQKAIVLAAAKKQFVYDLLSSDPESIEFAKKVSSDTYRVRLLPPGAKFYIGGAIYGNKIAILAVTKDLFGVIIESQEVADSFRTIYDLAWAGARPIEEMP